MRRSLLALPLAAAAGVAAAVVMTHGAPQQRLGPTAGQPTPLLAPAPQLAPSPYRGAPTTVPLTADQIRSTATRWVSALWSRAPGQRPFDWLNAVADITAPDLAAQLRSARATLDDQLTLSASADIDGVYPSAVDPNTVTVTCVAHRRTTTGPLDQPCATTVTVAPGPAGAPLVTAVQ